jgi:hypothetical protein
MNFDNRFADDICYTCGVTIPQKHFRAMHHEWHNGRDAEIERLARLEERKLAAFHDYNPDCTCFHCRRIAALTQSDEDTIIAAEHSEHAEYHNLPDDAQPVPATEESKPK